MIKGRFLFLYHTDHRSSWDTARCPCARIFPFITAILTPLCALQPLFPVHKGRCKPRVVLGRPKLIIGDSAGSQLIAESCRNLWEELFQHTCQQGGCSHFSIPKTVVGYWAFFHLQKHEGLMCCQVEQSCSVHKGVWMSPSDGFRWLISDEHGWVQAHSCAYGHHWKADCTYQWAVFRIQPSDSRCVFTSLSEHFQFFSGACSTRGNWKRQQVYSAVSCGASPWIVFTVPWFLMPHSWEIMRKLVPGLHFCDTLMLQPWFIW